MSIEEAIKKLEHYRYCLKFQYDWYNKDDDEALDMAIMALEYMYEDWAEYEEYCKRKESEKEWKN